MYIYFQYIGTSIIVVVSKHLLLLCCHVPSVKHNVPPPLNGNKPHMSKAFAAFGARIRSFAIYYVNMYICTFLFYLKLQFNCLYEFKQIDCLDMSKNLFLLVTELLDAHIQIIHTIPYN